MSRIIVGVILICSRCAQTLETEGLVHQRPTTRSYEILVKPCSNCLLVKERKSREKEIEAELDILCVCGHERWRHTNDGECSVLYPPNVGTWCPCKEFKNRSEDKY